MTDPESSQEVWLLSAAALAAGPATAILHESGILSLGPSGTLWPIGFIVVAALSGMGTGLAIANRVSRTLGLLVSIPNLLVLAPYGFLLLFFGLGGSR
jgi:hypothetical protein